MVGGEAAVPMAALETASQRSRDSEWSAMALHHCLPRRIIEHTCLHTRRCYSGDYLLKAFYFIFFNFWLCWVFVAVQAFLWLWREEATLVHGLLPVVAFLVVEHGL